MGPFRWQAKMFGSAGTGTDADLQNQGAFIRRSELILDRIANYCAWSREILVRDKKIGSNSRSVSFAPFCLGVVSLSDILIATEPMRFML